MESPHGPPLLGALLRRPHVAVNEELLERLQAAGYADLVPAHLQVLRYPGPHGRRPSDIATDMRMSKQAVNYLLGQLEQLGYLRRVDDPDDARSRRIDLTDRGQALAYDMRAAITGIEDDLRAELGAREFGELRRLLERLNATAFVAGAPGT